MGRKESNQTNKQKTNYRVMQVKGEHSAILLTFIKLPFVINVFVLSIFEGPFTQVLLYDSITAGI